MTGVPRVSVVVPLYQKAGTVSRSVASILSQSFADFELIVVDDGSTDAGPQIVAAVKDSRVRLIAQANAGPGAARNRGMRAARGEYVAFLDADDAWRPQYLERMVAALDAAPAAGTVTCAYATNQRSLSPLWYRRGLRAGLVRTGPSTDPALVIALVAMLSPCTTLVRRATALRLGGFYERDGCRYGEDAYFAIKLAFDGPVVVLLETLVDVDTAASALSVRRPSRALEPIFEGAAGLFEAAPKRSHPLLREVLAIRAGKAACVMAYWGRPRDARQLMTFTQLRDARRPWVALGRLCASPLGALAGQVIALRRLPS